MQATASKETEAKLGKCNKEQANAMKNKEKQRKGKRRKWEKLP